MSSRDAHSSICTKQELLRRLRESSKPVCAATLDLDGHLGNEVRRQGNEERHSRIARLRNALASAQSRLEAQHTFARLSGYAKARFKNER